MNWNMETNRYTLLDTTLVENLPGQTCLFSMRNVPTNWILLLCDRLLWWFKIYNNYEIKKKVNLCEPILNKNENKE